MIWNEWICIEKIWSGLKWRRNELKLMSLVKIPCVHRCSTSYLLAYACITKMNYKMIKKKYDSIYNCIALQTLSD